MIETGVSNHHLLILSFLKTFTKMQPNKLCYRKCKLLDKIRFLKDASNFPKKTNYTEWENQFLRVLNKHAPLKWKVIRKGDNKPFVTKTLRKAIVWRYALKKKPNDFIDQLAIKLYKKQSNYIVNLSWKVKKDYFQKNMPQLIFQKLLKILQTFLY